MDNFLAFFIAVSLQPFEYDPQEKNRHKFMVQSMFAPEGDINPDTLVSLTLTFHDLISRNFSRNLPIFSGRKQMVVS